MKVILNHHQALVTLKQKGYKTHIHVPNSACFYFMSEHPKLKSRMWIAYGEDCVIEMIIELSKIAEECIDVLKENQKMEMSKEDYRKYYSAKCCHICNKKLMVVKIITGKFETTTI